MRQSTPITVKTSVGEAAVVLDSLLNTHKCLLQNGVEIQNRLESQTTSSKMEIFRRPRSASLRDTPKTQSKWKKREAPFPPEERIAKKGKRNSSPSHSQATRNQPLRRLGSGNWHKREKKKSLSEGIEKSRLQCWKDLIGDVEKESWGLAFIIVTKRLVTRRKTPGLDNPDRVKYIL